jgi:hypothetical protein
MWNAIKRIFKLPTTDAEHAGFCSAGPRLSIRSRMSQPAWWSAFAFARRKSARSSDFYAVDRATMAVELIVDDRSEL